MPKPPTIVPSRNNPPTQSYVALIKQSASSWMEDNCPRLAAALAFYTFLSIAPLLIITTKVSFLFFDPAAATKGMNQQISGLVGKAGAMQLMI